MHWPWTREHREPADEIATRLDELVGELEESTGELRSLVAGLRISRDLPPTVKETHP
jgi:tetrahydromethanopterin S-methyltransferase subunit G